MTTEVSQWTTEVMGRPCFYPEPGPPLFWVKKTISHKEAKLAGKQNNSPHPSLSWRSGSQSTTDEYPERRWKQMESNWPSERSRWPSSIINNYLKYNLYFPSAVFITQTLMGPSKQQKKVQDGLRLRLCPQTRENERVMHLTGDLSPKKNTIFSTW